MRLDQVPQDDDSFYDGHKRAIYATTSDGKYIQTQSKGWSIETFFTSVALDALDLEYAKVLEKARMGMVSPLAVHMVRRQMTAKLLAESAGLFTFRVKRHLRPQVFNKLSDPVLKKYADCLNMTVAELEEIPSK